MEIRRIKWDRPCGSWRRSAVHIDYKAIGILGPGLCIPATFGCELEHCSMGKTIIDLCAGTAPYIHGTGERVWQSLCRKRKALWVQIKRCLGLPVPYGDRDMDGASIHKPACVQQDDPIVMFSSPGRDQRSFACRTRTGNQLNYFWRCRCGEVVAGDDVRRGCAFLLAICSRGIG